MSEYVHQNLHYIRNNIRLALKDEMHGKMEREELAQILHAMAAKIVAKNSSDKQLALWERDANESVKEHLRQNRMIK